MFFEILICQKNYSGVKKHARMPQYSLTILYLLSFYFLETKYVAGKEKAHIRHRSNDKKKMLIIKKFLKKIFHHKNQYWKAFWYNFTSRTWAHDGRFVGAKKSTACFNIFLLISGWVCGEIKWRIPLFFRKGGFSYVGMKCLG